MELDSISSSVPIANPHQKSKKRVERNAESLVDHIALLLRLTGKVLFHLSREQLNWIAHARRQKNTANNATSAVTTGVVKEAIPLLIVCTSTLIPALDTKSLDQKLRRERKATFHPPCTHVSRLF